MADIYFWRQLFVLITGQLVSLSVGVMLAFPSVLNPAILSPNTTDVRTTSDHASWIGAMNGFGGILGSFVQSSVMHVFGRKASHCCVNAFFIIGWLIFPFTNYISGLYAARFIQGIGIGGIYINGFIISEYVNPRRRGYFLVLKKTVIIVGIFGCHALSAFWSWRQIAIFAGIFPIIAFVMTLFWPESPSHLALKGRFKECEDSFKWLNGNSEESQSHLKSLIETQKTKFQMQTTRENSLVDSVRSFFAKDFQKVFWISTLLTLSTDLSGRYIFTAYMIQIMKELLNNDSSALYFTLGADLFMLIALSTSAIVVNFAKRRTILFYSGAFSVLLMLSSSILVYLTTVYTFSKYTLWFTGLMLILQCFIANMGLIPIAFALIGEIFPLHYKGLGSWASCFVYTSLYAVFMKLTPVLIEHTHIYGTYAVYGVCLAICLLFLYKAVPETKDKTLQAIEEDLIDDRNMDFVREHRKLMTNS